jgi:hypothetical protein
MPRTIIAAAALVAAFNAPAALADPLPFSTETVLHDFMWNSPTSTAIDSGGNVHIAYMTQVGTDSNSKEIWYARRDACTLEWSFTRITNNTVREEFPCLALDPDEHVHIAFHTGVVGGTNMIRYVHNVGAAPGQFNPIIDITGNGYSITRVRIDSTGVAHFAFRTHSGGSAQEIIYTTYTSGAGVGPLVNISNTPASDDYGMQIAIDSNDKVHIVWQRGSPLGGPLGYVHNMSGNFVMQTTGVSGSVVDPHLLIASDGKVTILYRPNLDSMLYIENAGAGFSAPAPVYTGAYRSAFVERPAVDQDGFRYVAFASNIAANHGTFFVRETAEGWQPPQLLQDGQNQGASVALNGAGTLVVSYQLSGVNNGQVYADIFLAQASIGVPCVADIAPCAGDGVVGVADLLAILNQWGSCDPVGPCTGDIAPPGGDELVSVADLLAVIIGWGKCP